MPSSPLTTRPITTWIPAGRRNSLRPYGEEINGGGITEAGAASVPVSWTWGGGDDWAIGGVSIKPSSNLVVDTANDVYDHIIPQGSITIADLLSDKGADGFISLREAILAANNTANVGGPDNIFFDIGGGGQLQTIALGSGLDVYIDRGRQYRRYDAARL